MVCCVVHTISEGLEGREDDNLASLSIRMADGFTLLNLGNFLVELRFCTHHKVDFVTEQGRFGIGYRNIVVNDVITTFQGAPCPYILHPLEDDE